MTITTRITVTKEISLYISYGRIHPRTARRWYLEAVCRETGRRVNAKFVVRPTKKQIRKYKKWAIERLRFSLYWDEI